MNPELQAQLRAALAVTPEKLEEVVRRLIDAGDPRRIVAFGSRARGDYSPDSDLDLAVILKTEEPQPKVGSWLLEDIDLKLDLLITDWSHFVTFREYPTSVHHSIEHEGLVLYDCTRDTSANTDAVDQIIRGRDRAQPTRFARLALLPFTASKQSRSF